jgi:acetolactate synthase-1/2/3 large subunit
VNGSELFVRCLEEEGVTHVFGVPGEETLDLLEALRCSGIEFIATRHEQHAAFMAATHGRLTGRAGVCLSTLGPGATNLVTGIAYAQLGGMPLITVSGQKPLRGNLEGNFQLLDVVGITESAPRLKNQG